MRSTRAAANNLEQAAKADDPAHVFEALLKKARATVVNLRSRSTRK